MAATPPCKLDWPQPLCTGFSRSYHATAFALFAVGDSLNEARIAGPSDYPTWPHLVGRGKYGEFSLMVVREHYRRQGYTVWFCEPALEKYADPDFVGFMLLSYPGRRRIGDPAFTRMQNVRERDGCETQRGSGSCQAWDESRPRQNRRR